jgi:hypothetical protein
MAGKVGLSPNHANYERKMDALQGALRAGFIPAGASVLAYAVHKNQQCGAPESGSLISRHYLIPAIAGTTSGG